MVAGEFSGTQFFNASFVVFMTGHHLLLSFVLNCTALNGTITSLLPHSKEAAGADDRSPRPHTGQSAAFWTLRRMANWVPAPERRSCSSSNRKDCREPNRSTSRPCPHSHHRGRTAGRARRTRSFQHRSGRRNPATERRQSQQRSPPVKQAQALPLRSPGSPARRVTRRGSRQPLRALREPVARAAARSGRAGSSVNPSGGAGTSTGAAGR